VSSTEPDRRRGEVFDSVAQAYDDVRRGYPAALVEAALTRGALGRGSRVVEVGCGTGKLTELLVARDLTVDAVDPGGRMIEIARRRVGGSPLVRFHVSRFEEVDLPERTFDAVFSATAFHWVDPAIGWRKAAGLLEPGGLLALLAHRTVADEHSAELEAGFREIWGTYLPDDAGNWQPRDAETLLAGAAERRGNVSELWDWLFDERHRLAVPEAAELFEDPLVVSDIEIVEETVDRSIALVRTTSSYFRIDEAERPSFEADIRRLFERVGGTARLSLMTLVVMAVRTG
jgi:ubiquinone/menaquinone biosynthesis C-methylase UbiE